MTRNTNPTDTPDNEYRYAANDDDIKPKHIGHDFETSNVGYKAHTVLGTLTGTLLGAIATTQPFPPSIITLFTALFAYTLTIYYVGTRSVKHTALIALTAVTVTTITAAATLTIAAVAL